MKEKPRVDNKSKTGAQIVADLELRTFVKTVVNLSDLQKRELDKSIWGEWR